MIMRFPGGLKKALTLSYDDGVEQDEQLIPILDAHGIRATFNISSGLYCPEGRVYEPGRIHRPMTFARAKALYDNPNHEVAVHCLTHANLTDLPVPQVLREVLADRENLEREFGGIIRGMAYPYGSFNNAVVRALDDCGIAYSRTVHSTHDFHCPENWLMLHPTCHHADPKLFDLCDRFLADEAPFFSMLFYLWGHSYEFEASNNWDIIEKFCEKMGGHEDIWYATNIEIVDYVNAYRSLRTSADGRTIFNPTTIHLYAQDANGIFDIAPGETVER